MTFTKSMFISIEISEAILFKKSIKAQFTQNALFSNLLHCESDHC